MTSGATKFTACGLAAGVLPPPAVPAGPKPAVVTRPLPVPPGVPPATPLENPAEATVPWLVPPGTPLATPEPNPTPWTTPGRAVPAPWFAPGAALKLPTATTVDGREALGLTATPSGFPKPPVWMVGAVLLLATAVAFGLANSPTLGCGGATTAFGGAGGMAGIAGAFKRTVSGLGGSGKGLGISILRGCSTNGNGGGVTL